MSQQVQIQKPIIFFDGVCGLCSTFVDFVIQIDPQARHMFSPLQGQTAETLLSVSERQDLDSVILYQNGKKLFKSQAVFQVFKNIGGIWSFIALLGFLPVSLTDGLYNLVAKYRYLIFGKKEICRIPTPAERKLFLD